MSLTTAVGAVGLALFHLSMLQNHIAITSRSRLSDGVELPAISIEDTPTQCNVTVFSVWKENSRCIYPPCGYQEYPGSIVFLGCSVSPVSFSKESNSSGKSEWFSREFPDSPGHHNGNPYNSALNCSTSVAFSRHIRVSSPVVLDGVAAVG